MKGAAKLIVSMAFVACLAACSSNSATDTSSSSFDEGFSESEYSYSSGSEQPGDSESYSSSTSGQSGETTSGSSQNTYIETDDRERKSIISNANDYEPGNAGDASDAQSEAQPEAGFTYAKLKDIAYYGLGNSFSEALRYSGRSSSPDYVGYGNNGMNGSYYTHFDNMDQNRYLMFRTDSDTYFNDNDYCYGVRGWFSRVFEYGRDSHSLPVSSLAAVLDAKSMYPVSSWPEDYFIPSNLDSSGLYAIEADLDTALGVRSCLILLEADSDSWHISDDTWVDVLIK